MHLTTATPRPQTAEDELFTVELYPGRVFTCRRLYLTDELMAGHIPNELLNFVLFDPFDVPDDVPDTEKAEQQRRTWQNYARICARSMVRPRCALQFPVKGDAIAISKLRYDEVRLIAWKAIKEAIPAIETAPFQSPGDESSGTGAPVHPGNDLPDAAEPVTDPAPVGAD